MKRHPGVHTRVWRLLPYVLALIPLLASGSNLAAPASPPPTSSAKPGAQRLPPPGCPDCEPEEPICDPEICDGFDNDCDGLVDEGVTRTIYRDADGDGHGAGAPVQGCVDHGWVTNNTDCNDANPAVWQAGRFYRDADGDGFGNPNQWQDSCGAPAGHVANATDCNDADATVKPGAIKSCGIGACATTVQACVNGVEQACIPKPATAELCDRIDNNCNGVVDDLPPINCGTGYCQRTVPACIDFCVAEETQPGKPPVIVCEWIANSCTPGQPRAETCNNIDDNCNGTVDDGVMTTYYADQDGDGYGAGAPIGMACTVPGGAAPNALDCNDHDFNVNPGVTKQCGVGECQASVPACVNGVEQTCTPRPPSPELCDQLDNDCNGEVDDLTIACGVGECGRTAPACANLCEWVQTSPNRPPVEVCEWGPHGVCTPGAPAPEVCDNGLDENCNGVIDDSTDSAALLTFYRDGDGDGYGASWEATRACRLPATYSRVPGDCDDTRADTKPGAIEVCDGIDNNCTGTPDDGNVCDQSLCQ
ncbi:putative metal-binding motif-containing protein [Myxococcus sp. XM-1-1-1]|uniref:putative metal-binding motif-containing protein n=1 Tax=Myxococcus sp. XM-1-1-1 TaxID=2874602 RepID=UPI001CBDEACD|nr:putative metal-binding motif-containing protein [Myxococcus sp. XM-1-1-1]MBZ4408803.1 putative metal-binding motif-containing protein [Myxococcus sp. XM-1-1-1]